MIGLFFLFFVAIMITILFIIPILVKLKRGVKEFDSPIKNKSIVNTS